MRENPVKRKLQAGEASFGALAWEFVTPGLPVVLERGGAEFCIFDMEHSGLSLETMKSVDPLVPGHFGRAAGAGAGARVPVCGGGAGRGRAGADDPDGGVGGAGAADRLVGEVSAGRAAGHGVRLRARRLSRGQC